MGSLLPALQRLAAVRDVQHGARDNDDDVRAARAMRDNIDAAFALPELLLFAPVAVFVNPRVAQMQFKRNATTLVDDVLRGCAQPVYIVTHADCGTGADVLFVYTAGLSVLYGLPELAVLGCRPDDADVIIGDFVQNVRSGALAVDAAAGAGEQRGYFENHTADAAERGLPLRYDVRWRPVARALHSKYFGAGGYVIAALQIAARAALVPPSYVQIQIPDLRNRFDDRLLLRRGT